MPMKKENTMKFKIRHFIQAVFFALVLSIVLNHTFAKTGNGIPFLSEASLHAICPFGGVVTLYNLITTGSFIQKIHNSSIILMAIVFLSALLFGAAFCGWICPFGSIQEWFGKIGKKIFKKKYNHFIPLKIDHILRYLRYFVLLLVVYLTAASGILIFEKVDPYFALFNFWTGEATILSIAILVLILLASLLIERPWCKYACPYGALLGIFNLFRIYKIRRNSATCIHCRACDRACPMNIKVSTAKSIINHQCISCLECTSELACPVKETVELRIGEKNQ